MSRLPHGALLPRKPEAPRLQLVSADKEPAPTATTVATPATPAPAAPAPTVQAAAIPASATGTIPPPHAAAARYVWRALHAIRALLRGRLTAQRVEIIADCLDDACLVAQRVVAELNRWGDETGWFFDVRSLRRRLLQAARGEVVIR